MLCGFREVSRFVKTTRIHLKQATYLHCTVEIGHFALYPVRLKSISDPFKNIRNKTIYQCVDSPWWVDDPYWYSGQKVKVKGHASLLHLVQLITQERFAHEASNLVGR